MDLQHCFWRKGPLKLATHQKSSSYSESATLFLFLLILVGKFLAGFLLRLLSYPMDEKPVSGPGRRRRKARSAVLTLMNCVIVRPTTDDAAAAMAEDVGGEVGPVGEFRAANTASMRIIRM
jgi:hypothetical protein